MAQRITNSADQTLTIAVPFNTLTPGTSPTPSSSEVQFRLRNGSLNGYRVTATVSFTNTLISSVAGGSTLAPADVGMAITSLVAAAGARQPRSDTVASGFSYDPGAVTAINGLTPYGGAAAGRASLQDIVSTPGLAILSGTRIANNDTLGTNNFLTVTMKFGVHRQHFTPGSVSSVITLTIANQ